LIRSESWAFIWQPNVVTWYVRTTRKASRVGARRPRSETIPSVPIDGLTAYAHVADVRRSIDFYRHLGLEVRNSHEDGGTLVWAFLTSPATDPNEAGARLMVALADGAVDPSQQAVLFYCWSRDVQALHTELRSSGIAVGEIERPFYMPAGEFRVADPDGYVLLVGQLSMPPA
jgi:catechol 2,3-dioxygenase-like lactoylglutathione lyase family enzyme